MNTNRNTVPSADGQRMLECLRQAVGKALERKRRLGQYAVVWQNGKPVTIYAEAPSATQGASMYARSD